MKRFLAILLASILLIAVIPAAAFAASPSLNSEDSDSANCKGTVAYAAINRNHGSIQLRKGPGYEFSRTHTLKHGDKLLVIHSDRKWSYVRLFRNGKKGWVRNHYVDGTCHALIHGVHMIKRKTPVYKHAHHTSKVLGTLLPGATVRVYKFSHSYAYVKGVNNSLDGGWTRIDAIDTAKVH